MSAYSAAARTGPALRADHAHAPCLQIVALSAVAAEGDRAYRKLTPEERKGVGILTWSFGSTGAVNFFGPEAGLPPAIGVHNQYWLWGPESYSGEKLLVLTADGDLLRRWFARVEPVEEVDCAYCMPFLGRASVYLCRKPRRPLRELWPEMKLYL